MTRQLNLKSKLPHTPTTIFTKMSALANEHGAINLSQGFPDFNCSPRLIELVHHNMPRATINIADICWSDLGTWQSLYEKYDKDAHGNAISGKDIMVFDSKENMVMAPDGKLVVLQGLENYCVIDTEDALLICRRDKEQEIKQINTEIKKVKGEKYL